MMLAPADAIATKRAAALTARCARHGWRLVEEGAEWVLYGNGEPAAFRSLDSLGAWLEKQEKPKRAAVEQLGLWEQAA